MQLLEVKDLKKGFGSETFNTRVEVLKGINLEMKRGELVALMGPSGCGINTSKYHWRIIAWRRR